MKGWGKREISEKTRRRIASSGTIPTRPGIEPGSHRWEASMLTTRSPRPLQSWCSSFRTARVLASHQGEPGSNLGGPAPRFPHMGILPDDATGRLVILEISRFPPPLHSSVAPYSPRFALIGSFTSDDIIMPLRIRGGRTINTFASHQGEPGFNPRPGRMWESCRTMPLVGGAFSGFPVSPPLPSSALKTWLLRAAQISPFTL
ncbi:hypothetical protein PR048_016781 [Dryococelus australis]|uniref:Uncharacterized protein n=1 Tax=Dryococelus australis TaxID=614101 RepID=A0ABQ9H7X1_9NEOP|nr:hypothetical protein PR048_016781 [Dryococelus australis]